ncbi:MAG: enoyl-CoA hydratase/isomerase family protein, partial [Myxococcaceae bacterium]
MAEVNVRVELDGPFATVTVDRPKSLNALDSRTLEELEKACAHLSGRPELRGVIVTYSRKPGVVFEQFLRGQVVVEIGLFRKETDLRLDFRIVDVLAQD